MKTLEGWAKRGAQPTETFRESKAGVQRLLVLFKN